MEEAEVKPITKSSVIHLLKLIRKEKYIIYKQTATFAQNIARQMRGNINTQMIEQFINGPESPLKIKAEIESITDRICK